MQLFDEFTERKATPPTAWRSEFAYLNASGIVMARAIRTFLETAFARYTGDKTQLRGRFRSPINAQHHGAAFELLLHELAWRQGCAPLADAPVAGGRIDLRLALREGVHGWLEARMLEDGENVHFARVRDGMDTIPAPDIQLELEMLTPLDRTISERKLKAAMAGFLQSLGATVSTAPDCARLGQPFIYSEDGRRLLKVVARCSREFGSSVISHVPDSEMPSVNDLRLGLRRKAKKYADLAGPYIIALSSSKMFVSDDLFEEALFSERAGAEGLWAHGRNRRVSAVLACCQLKPSALGGANVKLFHHPQAEAPIDVDLLGCEQIRMVEGRLVRTGAPSLAGLLGLPSDWPRAA